MIKEIFGSHNKRTFLFKWKAYLIATETQVDKALVDHFVRFPAGDEGLDYVPERDSTPLVRRKAKRAPTEI